MKTMPEDTLAALKGSIEKWERIAYYKGIDEGSNDCPLCQLFYHKSKCEGCPCADPEHELALCRGTLYEEWMAYMNYRFGGYTRRVYDDHSKALAIKELEFLKSLVPQEEIK